MQNTPQTSSPYSERLCWRSLAMEVCQDTRSAKGREKYDTDWVFASERAFGKLPVWPDSLRQKILQPAAKKAGITKQVGWHTFRHTYSTLLKANGEDVKVVQELMRHANITTTMNIYTRALTPSKRRAQSKAVDVLFDRKPQQVVVQ